MCEADAFSGAPRYPCIKRYVPEFPAVTWSCVGHVSTFGNDRICQNQLSRAGHDRGDAHEGAGAGQGISVLAVLQMNDAEHSLAVTNTSAAVTPDRRAGDRDAGRRSPGTSVVIGGTPPIRACAGALTVPARRWLRALAPPAGLEAAARCQVPGPGAAAVVAGNEVGITGARQCAVPLGSAHLCAGFICGNMEMPWWRGCGCFPGGQGVAGSNPAVPTGSRVFRKYFSPTRASKRAIRL